MDTIVIILYVLTCLLLTLVIILQPGKDGGMGALGGGGGATGGGVFGARGAVPFLAKATVWLGIGFGVRANNKRDEALANCVGETEMRVCSSAAQEAMVAIALADHCLRHRGQIG